MTLLDDAANPHAQKVCWFHYMLDSVFESFDLVYIASAYCRDRTIQ